MARIKETNHETSCHQEDFSTSLHVGMQKTDLIAWTLDQTNNLTQQ